MNITDDIKNVLSNNTVNAEDVSKVKEYIEALRIYDSLIESGMTTKRGNNLLSRDKAYYPNVRFNV